MRNIIYMRQIILLALLSIGALTPLGAAQGASPPLPPKIGYDELAARLADRASAPLLLDVRTAEEYRSGHIPGAILAPYDELEKSFREADKGRPIVVYCRSGRRSAIAIKTLAGMGYSNLSDFGGIAEWRGRLEKGD
jgi:rhodanese-related sulfurtransferase